MSAMSNIAAGRHVDMHRTVRTDMRGRHTATGRHASPAAVDAPAYTF